MPGVKHAYRGGLKVSFLPRIPDHLGALSCSLGTLKKSTNLLTWFGMLMQHLSVLGSAVRGQMAGLMFLHSLSSPSYFIFSPWWVMARLICDSGLKPILIQFLGSPSDLASLIEIQYLLLFQSTVLMPSISVIYKFRWHWTGSWKTLNKTDERAEVTVLIYSFCLPKRLNIETMLQNNFLLSELMFELFSPRNNFPTAEF